MKELQLQNISVRFGQVQALTGVSASMQAGETLLLAGPNGAGKSTLIQVLLGLIKPHGGRVLVDGRVQGIDKAFKRRIAYLPESVAFSDNLSGRGVLRFFASARGVPKTRVEAALDRVGLAHAASRPVRGYSRGMRQRLGLAVVILAEPELLLLDEPTGGLDQEGITVLTSILQEWREAGRMVLVSSHDLTLFERKVDRICLLRQGSVQALDTPAGLRESAFWLPVRVTFGLAESGTASDALVREVSTLEDGHIVSASDDALVVDMVPRALRDLLGVQARHHTVVRSVRVEEPGMDAIYESLLNRPEVLHGNGC